MIVRSSEHSAKVLSAISVMLSGIVTSARSAHWKNTFSLRLERVSLAGIVIDFMPVAEKAFQQLKLRLPAEGWKDFLNIVPIVTTGVTKPEANNVVAGYYDLSGKRIEEPQKGLNIIKYTNGQTKKLFIK